MDSASTASDLRHTPRAALSPRAQLFVVMNCGAPLETPSRHSLEGIDEVTIGRGAARQNHRTGGPAPRRLVLHLRDSRVSAAHAKLLRREGEWVLEDLGSKNGCFVNGAAVRATRLSDGDRLQIGHTLLVLRTALPSLASDPLDLEASAPVPALATLLPSFARDLNRLAVSALQRVPILLASATGTGKEVLARAVHDLSRRTGAFVPVNCGGLPTTLLESALFGHKRGAFSGAVADHLGLVRAADGGTLLLDEIGDMPGAAQVSLLRALQDGEIWPVGATQPSVVDVRVIAATHRDLPSMVADGRFREDLFARLAGFTFRLPELRERREDLGLLVGVLLRRLARESGRSPALSPEVGTALLEHAWPRNVRELEKCLAHGAALAGDGRIELDHLPAEVREGAAAARPCASRDEVFDRLVHLLSESGGNVSFVADRMRTSRTQVHRWMKRYAIEPGAFRRG